MLNYNKNWEANADKVAKNISRKFSECSAKLSRGLPSWKGNDREPLPPGAKRSGAHSQQ